MHEVQQVEHISQSPCIGRLMSQTCFVFFTNSGAKSTEESNLKWQHAIAGEVSSYATILSCPST